MPHPSCGFCAAQAQAALQSPLLGALFLVGGFQGRMLVYENL